MEPLDTKTQILNAAERLFGEHGFGGTSMRALTAAAGVNLAAVNYHFRSKEGLLDALFARRLDPMNRERLAMLDEVLASAGDQPPALEQVIRALVWPPLRLWHDRETDGARFLRLLGRVHSEPGPEVRGMLIRYFDQVQKRFTDAIARCMPGSDPADRIWGAIFTIGAMAHSVCTAEQLAPRYPILQQHDPEALCHRLVTYTTAGLRAIAQQ